jgi:ferritin-like metal-binding protein YciE
MMDESSKIKEVVARGKQRFFERHPQLLKEAEAITEREAEALGKSVGEMQEIAKYRAIARAAKTMGKDSLMMLMELGSNSKEELDQLIAAQNTQIKRSIGM